MLKANPHSKFKGTFVGMPLREELFCKDKTKALKTLGINNPTNKKVLLILGGSLGAQAINDAVVSNIDELTKTISSCTYRAKTRRKRYRTMAISALNTPTIYPHFTP